MRPRGLHRVWTDRRRCPAGWDADERECRHGRTPQSLTTRLCGPNTNLVAGVDAIEVERRIGSDAIVLRGNMTRNAPFQDRWLMTAWGLGRVKTQTSAARVENLGGISHRKSQIMLRT